MIHDKYSDIKPAWKRWNLRHPEQRKEITKNYIRIWREYERSEHKVEYKKQWYIQNNL